MTLDSTASAAGRVFGELLDRSAISLAPEHVSAFAVPADELHQEILLPLLPAMLGDSAIRAHWQEQKSTGFFARLQAHLIGGESPPRWTTEDFSIHVTASYSAGPDARALADTLLSEDGLRELTAALLNQVLEAVWPELTPLASPLPAAPAEAEELAEFAETLAPAPTPQGLPLARPVFTPSIAAFAAEHSLVGPVDRAFLARPKPWDSRKNPLAGTRHDIPATFRNVLISNPLETRHAR